MKNDQSGKVIISIDNVPSGPPAAGLLTKAYKDGSLEGVNWKDTINYKNSATLFAVKEAQKILLDWPDEKIKSTWIRIEEICRNWRTQRNCEIVEGQKALPIQVKAFTNNVINFRLSRDSECFHFMQHEYDINAQKIFNEIGYRNYFAVMILYENHFDFIEDVLESYSSLKEYENNEIMPDAVRGKKLIEAAKKGHEVRYGPPETRDLRDKEIQSYIDGLHHRNKSLSYLDLRKKASIKFKLSSKQIQRIASNPKKKS